MTMDQLRTKLADVNLSALARDTGLDLRTLRRIRNDPERSSVRLGTIEKIERALRKRAVQ